MEKEKIVVSKVKIIVDNSDGTHTDLESVMPKEVADKLLCDTIGWKENWTATMAEWEEYQEAEKEFTSRPKKKK
jgi:hypothetical protein